MAGSDLANPTAAPGGPLRLIDSQNDVRLRADAMLDPVFIVLWLVGGSVLAWFVLTRLRTWMDGRLRELDEVSRAPKDDEQANDRLLHVRSTPSTCLRTLAYPASP
jgi:hypothetical protein